MSQITRSRAITHLRSTARDRHTCARVLSDALGNAHAVRRAEPIIAPGVHERTRVQGWSPRLVNNSNPSEPLNCHEGFLGSLSIQEVTTGGR